MHNRDFTAFDSSGPKSFFHARIAGTNAQISTDSSGAGSTTVSLPDKSDGGYGNAAMGIPDSPCEVGVTMPDNYADSATVTIEDAPASSTINIMVVWFMEQTV